MEEYEKQRLRKTNNYAKTRKEHKNTSKEINLQKSSNPYGERMDEKGVRNA